MNIWTWKRIGFTACSALYTVALCFLLVKMLAGVATPWSVIILVSVSVAVALGRMVYVLGAAAEKIEADHRHHLPQNWTQPVATQAICEHCLDADAFVLCKGCRPELSMCWPCGYAHSKKHPYHLLIPFGTPELVKKI